MTEPILLERIPCKEEVQQDISVQNHGEAFREKLLNAVGDDNGNLFNLAFA